MNLLLFCESGYYAEQIVPALRLVWRRLTSQTVPYGDEGLWSVRDDRPDLVVLCSDLLDSRVWRAIIGVRRLSDVPVAVAIEHGESADMIGAISAGADEFISLPCNPTLVMARAAALMRRVARMRGGAQGWIRYGDVAVNSRKKEALLGASPLFLTPTEFGLLHLLASHRNMTLPQEFIQKVIWPRSMGTEGDAPVDEHIRRLGLKLRGGEGASCRIQRIAGSGYRFS